MFHNVLNIINIFQALIIVLIFFTFSDDAMRRLDEFTKVRSPPKIKIRMQQNIIVCDCRSKHFIEWLNKTDADIEGWKDFKCIDGYPSSNIGKTLKEVKHGIICC